LPRKAAAAQRQDPVECPGNNVKGEWQEYDDMLVGASGCFLEEYNKTRLHQSRECSRQPETHVVELLVGQQSATTYATHKLQIANTNLRMLIEVFHKFAVH